MATLLGLTEWTEIFSCLKKPDVVKFDFGISMFIFFLVLFVFSKNKDYNGLLKFSVLCLKPHCNLFKELQGKENFH